MARISVKPIKPAQSLSGSDSLFEMACLVSIYYPQYTPDSALNLSVKRLRSMLKVADKYEALRNNTLLRIVIAPHTKKPQAAVESLEREFQEVLDG